MKIIIKFLVFATIFMYSNTNICQSTTYVSKVIQSQGLNAKGETRITITDSLMVLKGFYKGEWTQVDYDVVNKRNGAIYVTDGVETHKITFEDKNGKAKGFKYSKKMYFTHQNGLLIVYFMNENI